MQRINISKILIIIAIFCILAISASYFVPTFFIKKKGQFCLTTYHCKNIDCQEEEKIFKVTVTPFCMDKINECICNPHLGGGFLLNK